MRLAYIEGVRNENFIQRPRLCEVGRRYNVTAGLTVAQFGWSEPKANETAKSLLADVANFPFTSFSSKLIVMSFFVFSRIKNGNPMP